MPEWFADPVQVGLTVVIVGTLVFLVVLAKAGAAVSGLEPVLWWVLAVAASCLGVILLGCLAAVLREGDER